MQVRKLSRLSLGDRRESAPRPRAPARSAVKQAPRRFFTRGARRCRRDGTRAAGRQLPGSPPVTANMGMPRQSAALSRHAFNHTRSDGGLTAEQADTFPHGTVAMGAAGAHARRRAPASSRRRDPGHNRCLMGQNRRSFYFADVHRLRCLGRTFYPVPRLHHSTGGNYPQPGGGNSRRNGASQAARKRLLSESHAHSRRIAARAPRGPQAPRYRAVTSRSGRRGAARRPRPPRRHPGRGRA
jgi:hypothetical protein